MAGVDRGLGESLLYNIAFFFSYYYGDCIVGSSFFCCLISLMNMGWCYYILGMMRTGQEISKGFRPYSLFYTGAIDMCSTEK